MILTCPVCKTRYRVDDATLADPAGRELRCAQCGHEWRYVPAPAVIEAPAPPATPEPPPATAPPLLIAPAAAAPATASRPVPPPAAARSAGAGIGCLVVIVIIAALIAAAVLARHTIVAAFPPLGRVYTAVGLRLNPKPEPLGAGLQIGKVAPSRSGDVLVVEGDIANTTSASRAVPRLRVVLRDAAGKELTAKVIDPPTATLQPGANARFRTEFDHPSDAATGVAVTFSAK